MLGLVVIGLPRASRESLSFYYTTLPAYIGLYWSQRSKLSMIVKCIHKVAFSRAIRHSLPQPFIRCIVIYSCTSFVILPSFPFISFLFSQQRRLIYCASEDIWLVIVFLFFLSVLAVSAPLMYAYSGCHWFSGIPVLWYTCLLINMSFTLDEKELE